MVCGVMSITTYENAMECRFKDVHKTNTVKLCEVTTDENTLQLDKLII